MELNIEYKQAYNGSKQPFIHILGRVPISEFEKSKSFKLVDDIKHLKQALKDLPFSLTKSGIRFSGYELKNKDIKQGEQE
ncbi:hypothetical protein [Bacillus toyonensis]|uniref:hypothetical protein n=1 Tax=Bacillus toyonensis TaxID=155322 RepID=UPI000BEBE74E|nr:hypothetical protein [Bacillus toyonensis]PDY52294.1 hypothetical protein CON61_15915 [Bacillus toyonensis]